ncbi:MAG TPA: sodium:solute symporter [Bryobacteraceae bacterium]|nr:sodium:solute symporter [Bryobacteraceae bacterium]
MRWLDPTIIVIYMAVMAAVGIRFSRRQNSTERYFVAKRSIPAWAMGLSLLATLISSVTFIAYPGSAYASDWSNLVPGLTTIPVLILIAVIVIPFFRHVAGMSAYEYFGKRFGYPARVYSSLAYALGHFSKMGFVFYLLALTATSMTGWPTDQLIVAAGAVTIGYTLLGGIEAVIWADVIQGFVLWFGIAICLGYLLFLPPGGPAAMFHTVAASHKISLGSLAPDLHKPTVLTLGLYGFFYYLQRYSADQTMIQRYLTAKSDRDAIRGVVMGSLLCVPVWTLFMLIGSLCWAYYRITAEAIPAYASKSDQVFPYFITQHVPPGLAGLFLAGLFGAAMANLSSDFNSLSAVFVEDYYRVWKPEADDRRRLRIGKIVVGVCGTICVAIAIVLARSSGSALSLWYTVSAIVSGGLVGLFLLAFLVPRASAAAAYAGVTGCLVFTAWATLNPKEFGLHNYMIGVIAHLIVLGGGAAASLLVPNRDPASRELTLQGWLRRSGRLRAVAWTAGDAP